MAASCRWAVLFIAISLAVTLRPQEEGEGGANLDKDQAKQSSQQQAVATSVQKELRTEIDQLRTRVAELEAKAKKRAEDEPMRIAVTHGSAFVALNGKKSSSNHRSEVSAMGELLNLGTGVDITPDGMNFLYGLIDAHGNDGIDPDEWKKAVKGASYGDAMYKALDKNNDKKVDDKEFAEWDPALDVAMDAVDTDKNKAIDDKELATMKLSDKQTKWATDAFLKGDGKIDRAEFEEMIYVVLQWNAITQDDDNVKFADFSGRYPSKILKAKDEFKTEDAFKKQFGDDGMDIGELYDYDTKVAKFWKPSGGDGSFAGQMLPSLFVVAIAACTWQ